VQPKKTWGGELFREGWNGGGGKMGGFICLRKKRSSDCKKDKRFGVEVPCLSRRNRGFFTRGVPFWK